MPVTSEPSNSSGTLELFLTKWMPLFTLGTLKLVISVFNYSTLTLNHNLGLETNFTTASTFGPFFFHTLNRMNLGFFANDSP